MSFTPRAVTAIVSGCQGPWGLTHVHDDGQWDSLSALLGTSARQVSIWEVLSVLAVMSYLLI